MFFYFIPGFYFVYSPLDSRSQDGGLNISHEHQVPASPNLNLTQLSASPFSSPPQISSQRIAGGGGDVRGIDVALKPNVTGVDTEKRLELTHDVSNAMDSSDSKEFEDDDDGSLQGRSEILTPLRKSRKGLFKIITIQWKIE